MTGYRKPNQKGRRDGAPAHVRLYHWMTDSHAWHSLSPNSRALYCELARRYNGRNNGQIHFSLQEAADALHIGKATAFRAFQSLEDRGFIRLERRGGFNMKGRHASEWRLTEFSTITGNGATKDASKEFMRWEPGADLADAGKKNTGSVVDRIGSVADPIGFCSGPAVANRARNGF
jgi:hypothetical protein